MEKWSVGEDDRPYLRPTRRPPSPWLFVVAIGAAAWIVALSSRFFLDEARHVEPMAPASSAAPAENAPAMTAAASPVRHRLRPAAESSPPLPKLEDSDPLAGRSVAGLVGSRAFAELFVPQNLVRRIVATVDNLPRETSPQRMLPLNPVPGDFATQTVGEVPIIAPTNFSRYTPYVQVFEMVVPSAMVLSYVRAYPLFQRAYEELGYPDRYFNDRLMEAIDDLLLAPEIDAPPRVLRGRILYEFADPDLETRSAGQKIMLRMGPDNARRVKARLWEIRRELLEASAQR
jgi:hypothetical protein